MPPTTTASNGVAAEPPPTIEPPAMPDGFLDVHGRPRRIVAQITDRYHVQQLLAAGRSLRGISRDLKLDYYAVRRYARAEGLDELLVAVTHRRALLDGYKAFLYQQYTAGQRNASELFRQIRAQGYRGSPTPVGHYIRLLKKATIAPPPPKAQPSPRKTTSWILTPPDKLHPDQIATLADIRAHCPQIDAAVHHVRASAAMMKDLRRDRLSAWIDAVRTAELPHLRQFADGLLYDLDAVTAGLTSTWSSGQVEGQNTRVKLIKRLGYGRANFDLLRKHILLQA